MFLLLFSVEYDSADEGSEEAYRRSMVHHAKTNHADV